MEVNINWNQEKMTLWVTGSTTYGATSGSINPVYVRSGHSWLQLSVPSNDPYSGLRVIHKEHLRSIHSKEENLQNYGVLHQDETLLAENHAAKL